ncbi:hypothetical protein MTO96_048651 [Rhipicephalus appendiculatus]
MMVSLMFYGLDADEEESFNGLFLYALLEIPARREAIIALQSTILVTPFALLRVKQSSHYFRYLELLIVGARRRLGPRRGQFRRLEQNGSSASRTLDQQRALPDMGLLRLSAIASAIVVLYGLTCGYRPSLSWVRCNLINVLLGEFVVSPLKILCFLAVMASVRKAPVEMENTPVRIIE